MDSDRIEKYSSAITLSDMEIFVFPELMYGLVLANIMSPVIWRWREEECFKKLEGKGSYKKLMRLKQYIMDEYEFNLDLETWGLTSQDRELKRFASFVSPEEIVKSNALFGYQGDKYYFDAGIRKHFGLDKYDSDIIPYWKTETVEAMNAFRYKPGYSTGAGECVSLSALYAAAAFVVCGIPLEDIYMILTPLHSQNFIDINGGVLTNNRRLVTKTMWFNGSAISNKAQRALRNEKVTIVAHPSGYVHCMYDDATIDRKRYEKFQQKIGEYLTAELNIQTFASFLRSYEGYQRYFQLCRDCRGQAQFIKAEVLFNYEHNSNYIIGDNTHDKLLEEVSEEDFVSYAIPGRIRCDEFCQFIQEVKPDLQTAEGKAKMIEFTKKIIPTAELMAEMLTEFLHVEAKLPEAEKNYEASEPIAIGIDWERERIIDYLQGLRGKNETAELAFYSYRDMETCKWVPFVKAAIERNPVSIEMAGTKTTEEVYEWLNTMENQSIYEGKRLAQPDEIANYKRGDGLEKAFLLANFMKAKKPDEKIEIFCDGENVSVNGAGEYRFKSVKGLKKDIVIKGDVVTEI